jgi:hypothetical protein
VAALVARGDVVLAGRIQRAIDADEPLDRLTGRKEDGGGDGGAGGGARFGGREGRRASSAPPP